MAGMTDLAIRIATTYDSAGLNKADKGVKKLESTVKSLGRTLGLTLGSAAMAAYGKAAVKAFAADEAAARRLAGAVDNLGLSFSQAKVTDFIASLEQTAAIADDVLRPAFQSLLTTTGSLTKSQELLNNAIQISRASGIDLATVATDLGKGYVGITRGLVKYNTGLTRAEITTKSFNEILGIMLARSAGAAQDYLTTTSYKMEVLTVAAGNAQETIGKGLVDAFAKLGGGSTTSDAAKTINDIAKGINAITNAAATAVGAVVKLYRGLDYLTSFGGITGSNGKLVQYDKMMREKEAQRIAIASGSGRSASPAGTARRTAQQRQAEATAAKRAKELAALQAKQVKSQKALTDEQKKQNALKKAGTVFDLEQVQLIAALKGKLSDEDRKRVELQFALLTGNVKEAEKLTYELAKAQGLGEKLAGYLASLPDAKNPFASWEAYLDMLAKKAQSIAIGGGNAVPITPVTPSVATNATNASGFAYSVPNPAAGGSMDSQFGSGTPWAMAVAALNRPVVVQIDGKSVATSLQDSSLSGIPSGVNRTYGSFAGR
jgi:hypothetical protein